ncbi:Z1 domain-containing protein [Emcibacter sp. SYSU 3D8]|uniref:Z1 domain-containing protein n=1 Tax=Emcibacter sp. SYSU 3D8 TaxID=3133969 RepID=UPI0031FE9EA7
MHSRGFYERLKAIRANANIPESREAEMCVLETVQELISQPTDSRRPGMLLGKIQSGKTRSFLGIIAAAFDEGFDVAIVLTKGTRTLAKQTVNRISKEYASFRDNEELAVYDIMSIPELTAWEIEDQKLVIVAKKETNNLRRLIKLFGETHPSLAAKRVLIIDDEADFASIRFTRSKDKTGLEQGRIADQIDELRRELTNPAVLQVTATPYSLYLQPDEYDAAPGANFTFEPKRPAFTKLVPIHSMYVGGEQYFGEYDERDPQFYLWNEVTDDELSALKKEDRRRVKTAQALTADKIKGLRHGLVTFVTAAAIRRLQQRAANERPRRYSMIIHVETARRAHAWQHMVAGEILDALNTAIKERDQNFELLIDAALDDLDRSVSAGGFRMPDRQDIVDEVRRAFLKGAVVTEKVNSDNDVEALLDENAELRLRTPYNVFIGGQILDRGITVPGLIAFYYGRSPKRMQQDTVLQHARMYGTRPPSDLAVTRFYTTAHNFNALRSIHEFDAALRYAFETGAHDRGVAFVVRDSGNRIIPCAPGKILASDIVALRPGGALLPFGFQTGARTAMARLVGKVEKLITSGAISSGKPEKVTTEVAIEIINIVEQCFDFESGYGFDWEACRAAIEYFSRIASPPESRGYCWIFAETGRTLSRQRTEGRYSDAPHTYQDRAKVKTAIGGLPVLALFKQEGRLEDGWRDAPFWWPVLFAPANAAPSIFASTIRDDDGAGEDDDS